MVAKILNNGAPYGGKITPHDKHAQSEQSFKITPRVDMCAIPTQHIGNRPEEKL